MSTQTPWPSMEHINEDTHRWLITGIVYDTKIRDESDRSRDGKTWRIKALKEGKIIESGQDADVHLVPEVAGGAAAQN